MRLVNPLSGCIPTGCGGGGQLLAEVGTRAADLPPWVMSSPGQDNRGSPAWPHRVVRGTDNQRYTAGGGGGIGGLVSLAAVERYSIHST